MNRNPYIWAVVEAVESASPGEVLQFIITRKYRYSMRTFAEGVRRNKKRKARVVVADRVKRVIIVKVKE